MKQSIHKCPVDFYNLRGSVANCPREAKMIDEAISLFLSHTSSEYMQNQESEAAIL